MLIITQAQMIRQVAEKEGIDRKTVRRVFEGMEAAVLEGLSSATATENAVIKLLDGLSLECNYIPAREMHTFCDLKCEAKIWAKAKLTRHYNRKLNSCKSSENTLTISTERDFK